MQSCGSGGIEYNEVSRVVNESDDQGGVDIFYNPSSVSYTHLTLPTTPYV